MDFERGLIIVVSRSRWSGHSPPEAIAGIFCSVCELSTEMPPSAIFRILNSNLKFYEKELTKVVYQGATL